MGVVDQDQGRTRPNAHGPRRQGVTILIRLDSKDLQPPARGTPVQGIQERTPAYPRVADEKEPFSLTRVGGCGQGVHPRQLTRPSYQHPSSMPPQEPRREPGRAL